MLTDTGDYLGFICTEGEGVGVYSSDGGEEGADFFCLLPNHPPPLKYIYVSRFNTHTQVSLGTFETRMAARSAKRAISAFLRKSWGL